MASTYQHPHVITVIEYFKKYIFLLLIPLLRGLLISFQGLQKWLSGAWVDLLILGFIIGISVLRYWFHRYRYTSEGIWVKKGVLIRSTLFIPMENISTLLFETPFYLKPFRAVRLRADTDAGPGRSMECSLTVSNEVASRMMGYRKDIPDEQSFLQRFYKPRFGYIAVLSAVLSNSFAGVVLFSTFLSQTGNLVGEKLKNNIVGTLTQISRVVTLGIPPAAAAVSILILLGWAIAFCKNFLRVVEFSVTRSKNLITISSGLFTRRNISCRVDTITSVDIRQSLMTKLLRMYFVFITCTGYGKEKDVPAVLVPSAFKSTADTQIKLLLPEFIAQPRQIKPPAPSVVRYIMIPFWGSALTPVATVVLCEILPNLGQLISFFGLMLTIPFIWLLALRIIDFATAGIAKTDTHLTLRFSKGYNFHTVVLPIDKIAKITLRASVFQKMDDNCDVLISVYGESRKVLKVENLYRPAVINLLDVQSIPFILEEKEAEKKSSACKKK